jgi:immune inhibitor A
VNSSARSRRSRSAALVTAVVALGATVMLPAASAQAQPQPQQAHTKAPSEISPHDLPGPFTKTQQAQRKAALTKLAEGKGNQGKAETFTRNGSKVMKLGKGKYVELDRKRTDQIFTILVEFGDKVDSKYGGDAGPMHNEIAKPDRSTNNSTYWLPDFNKEHYQDLYFGDGPLSLKSYYEKQSANRYSVQGDVQGWVQVPYNEARYGSDYCGSTICPTVWDLIRDGVKSWVEQQKAAGKTTAQIADEVKKYDQYDRYDYDGDGNFNEPDGYIDHFQIVHAGEDESAGGGVQGQDAIWAHRWYAYGTDVGRTGPADNKAGGTQIGDTGVWIGDYTMQPENGGLGVFTHEYGHDLGLPDEYDTSGGGDNGVGFWTLMNSGSWLNKGEDAIGDAAGDLSAWDKYQLGWLNYVTAKAGTKSTAKLGVQSYNTKNPQALIVQLPKKDVTTTIATPAEGSMQWWSGSGDNLSNTMTRSVDLTGKTSAALDFKAWYQIEMNYDYAYVEVSTDGGAHWTAVDGTVAGKQIPRDGSDRPGLSGDSSGYQDAHFSLDAYAGKKIDLRFRYQTDGGLAMKGLAVDALKITADGSPVFTDGAEAGDNGWTADGFSRIGESFTKSYPEFYFVENRQHVSYDKYLETGPYNFGFLNTKPNWVERYPYQTGMLVWLWDTSQKDNNTSVHPGEGQILPVDAHAKPEKWSDGTVMRGRVQTYDSPFSIYPSGGMLLHKDGEATFVWPKWGNRTFNDHTGTFWYKDAPLVGVKVPDTNTKISIVKQPHSGKTITVQVAPATK